MRCPVGRNIPTNERLIITPRNDGFAVGRKSHRKNHIAMTRQFFEPQYILHCNEMRIQSRVIQKVILTNTINNLIKYIETNFNIESMVGIHFNNISGIFSSQSKIKI